VTEGEPAGASGVQSFNFNEEQDDGHDVAQLNENEHGM
jgi:hypothetical protein